jgi:hypothetical protein
MKMDNIGAIGVGLGLRAVLDLVAGRSFVSSAFIGLWEGVVLNHFLAKYPSSMDPYLAFGFRLFVDVMFTASATRMLIVVLWTSLGVLLADVVIQITKDYRFRRLWRKTQQKLPIASSRRPSSSRSLPSRVRFYENPTEDSSTGSFTTTTSVASPGVPVRPTTTPLPGRFDQWSEVTPSTATEQSPAASDVASPPLPDRSLDMLEPVRPRTPSELEYIPLPVMAPATGTDDRMEGPSSRPMTGMSYPTIPDDILNYPVDDPAGPGSGLTTPRSGMMSPSRALDAEDRPYVHSGLTTPETRSPLQVQTSGLPSIRGNRAPSQPIRLTLADPSPTGAPSQPQILFPEPQITPTLIPPVTDIPNIPTPDDRDATAPEFDPPPSFQEAMKDVEVPDELQSLAEQESVISGGEKTTIVLKADEIRKKAREQEKERDRIRKEWKKAERQGQYFDALRLEVECEDAQAAVDGLHAKAARRYYHGE